MKILTSISVLIFSVLVSITSAFASDSSGYEKQQAVYHVNYYDTKRSIGAMRNAQNHINALGEGNHEIRFVLHGDGVELLRKVTQESDKAVELIDSLRNQGVKFNICNNTLVGRKIALEDLYFADASDVVPSGVAEIGKLQQQGFVYLRP